MKPTVEFDHACTQRIGQRFSKALFYARASAKTQGSRGRVHSIVRSVVYTFRILGHPGSKRSERERSIFEAHGEALDSIEPCTRGVLSVGVHVPGATRETQTTSARALLSIHHRGRCVPRAELHRSEAHRERHNGPTVEAVVPINVPIRNCHVHDRYTLLCGPSFAVPVMCMAKPKTTKAPKAATSDEMVSVNLRLPQSLLDAVDGRVEAINAAEPERWPRMTRLDWIRTAIAQAVKREAP